MNDAGVEVALVREGRVDGYETVVWIYQSRLRAMVANVCPPGPDDDEIAHLGKIYGYRTDGKLAPRCERPQPRSRARTIRRENGTISSSR